MDRSEGAEPEDGVDVYVRVQPGERKRGDNRGAEHAPPPAPVRRHGLPSVQSPAGGEDRVAEQEVDVDPAGHGDQLRHGPHQVAKPAGAGGDQYADRDDADGHYRQQMLTADALAEHVHVRGADGDKEENSAEKTVQSRGHGVDARLYGSRTCRHTRERVRRGPSPRA